MSMAESFAKSGFAKFVNSPAGRVARIVVGVILIGWGYAQLPETAGIILIVVGLVPLTAGVFHLCLISALLGGPISGASIAKSKPQ
jgi:F0F1-type ATP synthase assembly protein I